jgi:predicted ATPase
MRHIILTGAPGAGKTAVLRQLEVLGHPVVEEAATDVIALAHARGRDETHDGLPAFLDAIIALQERRRLASAASAHPWVFHDRSPICTLALAAYAGTAATPALEAALADIARDAFYDQRVMFVRNLGFIVNTAARRISFEETLRFEAIHEQTYRRLGYDLEVIEAGEVMDRARAILDRLAGTGRAFAP